MLAFALQPKKEKVDKVMRVDPFRPASIRIQKEMEKYDKGVVVVLDRTMVATVEVMRAWSKHFGQSTNTVREKLVSLIIIMSTQILHRICAG